LGTALAGLALVARDHPGFDATTLSTACAMASASRAKETVDVPPAGKRTHPCFIVLDDFGDAGDVFALWRRYSSYR
jgi:hypothetical protein